MDAGKSFSYVFQDQNWLVKILIGGILSLIPILNLAVWGYWIEAMRNVAQGRDLPLPEWGEDFGGKLIKGIVIFVIFLIYSIPILLIYGCLAVLGAAAGDQEDAQSLVALLSLPLVCILFIYGLLLGIFSPAIFIQYATTGQLSSAFAFGRLFQLIGGNLGNYILAIVLGWVAGFIAFFGIIACFVGVFFTFFWAQLVTAHLYGQVARGPVPAPAAA